MRTNFSVHSLLMAGVMGVGLVAGGCDRSPADEAARQRAATVEQQGEQAAERMRAQANAVEHQADQRADQIRDQAGTVAQQAEQRADQIRDHANAVENQAEQQADQIRDRSNTAARGPVISMAAARAQYAAARCERENGCNNIGQGRRYQSRDACITTASADRFDSWNTSDCTRGVDAAKLGDCLNAVRSQSCGNPIDDISRMNACRGAAVCTSTETHVSSL